MGLKYIGINNKGKQKQKKNKIDMKELWWSNFQELAAE